MPCPYCRRHLFEDSPRCPYCERYTTNEDHAGPSKLVRMIVTPLVCVGIAIWRVLGAF